MSSMKLSSHVTNYKAVLNGQFNNKKFLLERLFMSLIYCTNFILKTVAVVFLRKIASYLHNDFCKTSSNSTPSVRKNMHVMVLI